MYGLPSPNSGDISTTPLAVGAFVVYEGSKRDAWGRYRVIAVTEHPSGTRYDLSTYRDDHMVLRGASRRSIAAIPAGAPHRVLDPVERIDAVLQRRAQANAGTENSDIDPQLLSTVLSLLAVDRFVEAEIHLLRAECAIGILGLPAFRHRIEQLRIRGNDESYLPRAADHHNVTTTNTDDGTSAGPAVN